MTMFNSSLKGVDGKPRREIEESIDSLYKTLNAEVKKYPELKRIYGNFYFKHLMLVPKKVN